MSGGGRGSNLETQRAMEMVKLPAIFLIVTAALSVLGGLLGLLTPGVSEEQLSRMLEDPSAPDWLKKLADASAGGVGHISNLLSIVVGGVILFGIWSLVVLNRPEVKAAFARPAPLA